MHNLNYSRADINYTKKDSNHSNRIFFLIIASTVIFVIIIIRLFQLQVLKYATYHQIANDQHFGAITLNAKRGEILTRDTHSGDLSKLATNTTLDLVYVDPMVVQDKVEIAKKLAPLLFTKKDYDVCVSNPDECGNEVIDVPELDSADLVEPAWQIDPANEADNSKPKELKGYPEMVDNEAAKILRKISKEEVDFVVLMREAEPDLMADVVNEKLPGIFVDTKLFMAYGDPTLIPETQLKKVSESLAKLLDQNVSDIEKKLERRKVRYVFLKNKIEPEISRKIKDLDLKGVVLLPEHWRFYPDDSLAANIIGFLNSDKAGQYGIEEYFNSELEGKKGTIYTEKDPMGRQITVGKSEIVNAVDGDTVILTIDRIIQKKVEEALAKAVQQYKADGGQVVVMNPFTGAILAMANFPSYDPNNYSDVFKLRELKNGEIVNKTVPVFKLNDKGKYIPVEDTDIGDDNIKKFVYENQFGPNVFKNKVVSEYYEPGSAFKPIVMSIALDAKEVEPQTTYIDDGPLKIDNFEIKNSTNIYWGKTTMSEVLAKSLNTGMSFVAKKLGKELMYQYLKDFGFGDYTNIQLEGESKGDLVYFNQWSKAQLLTTSFGQGIIVTPLQLAAAWCALANGGKLMQPYIVDTVIRDGKETKTEPQVIRRVIAEETSSIITSMLINSVEVGYAKTGGIEGYLIAGKTGTSQIAGKNGLYEKGDGTTITSFAGYAPALEPKFVMLIKLDRPRLGENTWGENTAGPVFKEISEFILDYYNIQPTG